jgi:hypothetical protein
VISGTSEVSFGVALVEAQPATTRALTAARAIDAPRRMVVFIEGVLSDSFSIVLIENIDKMGKCVKSTPRRADGVSTRA